MRRRLLVLLLPFALACSSEDTRGSSATSGGGGQGGALAHPCVAGELLQDDGSCLAAGVAEEACAVGFVAEDGGCKPVLPDAPCPVGQMAVPGDADCRDIMSCGSGRWGEIPVAPSTQYVDASYLGGDSDGTSDKPWSTIGDGLSAAAAGAVVAVAAGSYPEDVSIMTAVQLWGRCPSMVEIVGQDSGYAALVAFGTAEVHGLAVSGPGGGIAAVAPDVTLDRVWVHDTGGFYGVGAQGDVGEAALTLRDSLVERFTLGGVMGIGGSITLERVHVRDPLGGDGSGVNAQRHPSNGTKSAANIVGSLIDHNRFFGVYVAGSTLVMEATVVRDTQPTPAGDFGSAVQVREDAVDGTRGVGQINSSVFDANRNAALVVADSDVSVVATSFVNTLSNQATDSHGRGIQITTDRGGPLATLDMRGSLLSRNRETGLIVAGAQATLESTLIRDTQPNAVDQLLGRGVSIQPHPVNQLRSIVTLRGLVVSGGHTSGIAIHASDVTIEDTAIRDIAPQALDDLFGRGITVQRNPTNNERAHVTIFRSLVERTHDVGISVVASDARIESSIVRDTAARRSDGQFGDGIVADGAQGQVATVELLGVEVAGSARAGIGNFAAAVVLSNSHFECNTIHLNGENLDGTFTFDAQGDVSCGCDGESVACKVLSANLEAPDQAQ
jgi:hypothetical protein